MKNYDFYDKEFRKKLSENPKSVLQEISNDFDINVVVNTKDTTYFVMPSNNISNGADLNNIQAAGTVGSVGTTSSLGTIGSLTSSASSVGSLGTVATAGSA